MSGGIRDLRDRQGFPDLVEAAFVLVGLLTLEQFIGFVLFYAVAPFQAGDPATIGVAAVMGIGITTSCLLHYKGMQYREVFHFSGGSGWRVVAITAGPLVITCAGLVLVTAAVGETVQTLVPMSEFFQRMFAQMTAGSAPSLLLLVLIAPTMEELLCRGVFLRSFLTQYSAEKAVVAASVLFALVHLNIYQIPLAFVFGLLSGWLFVQTASLWPSILAHALVNALGLLTPRAKALVDGCRGWQSAVPLSTIAFPVGGGLLLYGGVLTLAWALRRAQAARA